ncbi:hypothetical protein KVR01_000128 [Diaporthe batatas]|uniref:uncharacterized protein n=1 Tax=Diaporthe batatas TaxID=748121 RepID=UPI001D043937|nr:uncharacterized protein KVR01_000128 [Diaporthe batatas]KAG8169383.1 hypothetical protein KVR01_000128 [Diaporthe batatas]
MLEITEVRMTMIFSRSLRGPQANLLRVGLARGYSSKPLVQHVTSVDTPHESIEVARFRELAFDAGVPLLLKASHDGPATASMPAMEKWFQPVSDGQGSPAADTVSSYFQDFAMAYLPYELMYPQKREGGNELVGQFMSFLQSGSVQSGRADTAEARLEQHLASILRQKITEAPPGLGRPFLDPNRYQQLLRFHAPLALLIAALRHNAQRKGSSRLRQLYIAQCSLADLPRELSEDLPTPRLVREAGNGDIYASSVWLGLEPTYTPLHRDPNPNLFVQLRSSKTVRLLPPHEGRAVFREVQTALGRTSGSSRIRGEEMMQGRERELLHQAVWTAPAAPLREAELGPGDALFIPKGWWHSVRSRSDDGQLNGSVNWWFR